MLAGVAAADLLPPSATFREPSIRNQPSAPAGPSAERRPTAQRVLATGSIVDPGDSLVAHLRSLVGARDEAMTSVQFAIATLRGMGEAVDADLAGTTTGVDLVALAQSRDAWGKTAKPALGDLLVFDRSDNNDRPSSLVGVVIRRDDRGVIEFLYLQRGVIRRGFVDSRRPTMQRDDRQRVVNTHVRAGRSGDPRGTKYLAGELLSGVIGLQGLTLP